MVIVVNLWKVTAKNRKVLTFYSCNFLPVPADQIAIVNVINVKIVN